MAAKENGESTPPLALSIIKKFKYHIKGLTNYETTWYASYRMLQNGKQRQYWADKKNDCT